MRRLGGGFRASWVLAEVSWVRSRVSSEFIGLSCGRVGAAWRHDVLDFHGKR